MNSPAAVESTSSPGKARRGAEKTASASMFVTIGNIATFARGVLLEMPLTFRLYFSEVIRQAGILIISSGLVTCSLVALVAAEGGVVGFYLLGSLGASGYQGLFEAMGILKASSAIFYGLMLAAKVGCGFVAELGSMRITEEIDALHVMGIRPRAYLVGTRVAAYVLVHPFLFVAGIGMGYITGWFTSIPLLQATSNGGYWEVFWSFQTPGDLLSCVVWSYIVGLFVVVIGCYFGYNASGGPVGVGQATAKSMVLNVVVVNFWSMVLFQVFFGTTLQVPIAN